MAGKVSNLFGDNSSNTTLPESLLKKAARAYLIHTLQSQEQPSPISKSIMSDVFDIETFDFKVFQDMCGRHLTADDIRQVMLAIGVNKIKSDRCDELQLVAINDLLLGTAKKMIVDICKRLKRTLVLVALRNE